MKMVQPFLNVGIMQRSHPLSFNHRQAIYATILVFYLLPIVIFSKHSIALMSVNKSWSVLCTGLLISIFGSVILILLIRNWELLVRSRLTTALEARVAQHSLTHPPYPEEEDSTVSFSSHLHDDKITPLRPEGLTLSNEEQISTLEQALNQSQQRLLQLSEELKNNNHELHVLTNENQEYKRQLEQFQKEFEEYHLKEQNSFQQREVTLVENQHTIAELRQRLEEKESHILELETKVRDCHYEIRTLLQLEDVESASQLAEKENGSQSLHPTLDTFPSNNISEPDIEALHQQQPTASDRQVRTPYDAILELERCIDIAQNLKGAIHLNDGSSRLRDSLGADNYAIDLRLFDRFHHDTSSPIILYSPNENKLLFASNQITGITGWKSEEFVHDFHHLIQHGTEKWKETIRNLDGKNHQEVPLVLNTKSGQDVLVHCYLNVIPSGVFVNRVIGVLCLATGSF